MCFFLLDALLFIYICRRCILPFQFAYYFWWHRGWSEGDDGTSTDKKKYNRQTNPHPINMSKFSPIRQAALLFLVPFPLVIIIAAGIANDVATNLHDSVVVVYLFYLFASYINRCHCI